MILSIFVAKDEWKIILSSFPGEGAYKRYTLAFLLTNEKSILLCCFISRQQQQPYSIKGRCLCNVPKDFVKTFPFLYVCIHKVSRKIYFFVHSFSLYYLCLQNCSLCTLKCCRMDLLVGVFLIRSLSLTL